MKFMKATGTGRLTLARVIIAAVVFFNLQAALVFITAPAVYAPGFELSGVVGEKMVQGMGILFVMWNVPYLFALIHPVRFRISLIQAVIMQAVGVFGETLLWLTLPPGHAALSDTALRFISFDGGGFLALAAALYLVRPRN